MLEFKIFPPSPNFSAKALRGFTQLLPPFCYGCAGGGGVLLPGDPHSLLPETRTLWAFRPDLELLVWQRLLSGL